MGVRSLVFKSEYSVIVHNPDEVEVRVGVWNPTSYYLKDEVASGKLSQIVCGLKDGRSSKDLAKLGIKRSEIEAVVDSLVEIGAMSDCQTGAINDLLSHQISSVYAQNRNKYTKVVVLAQEEFIPILESVLKPLTSDYNLIFLDASSELGHKIEEIDAADLTDALCAERIAESFIDLRDSLLIYVSRDASPLTSRVIDCLASMLDFPWIHASIDGPFVFIGPTIVPHHTANYADFETRMLMNMKATAEYQRYKTALVNRAVKSEGVDYTSPISFLTATHVGIEAINYLTSGSNFTINKVLGIFLPTMEFAFHSVLPIPSARTEDASEPVTPMKTLYYDIRQWIED